MEMPLLLRGQCKQRTDRCGRAVKTELLQRDAGNRLANSFDIGLLAGPQAEKQLPALCNVRNGLQCLYFIRMKKTLRDFIDIDGPLAVFNVDAQANASAYRTGDPSQRVAEIELQRISSLLHQVGLAVGCSGKLQLPGRQVVAKDFAQDGIRRQARVRAKPDMNVVVLQVHFKSFAVKSPGQPGWMQGG